MPNPTPARYRDADGRWHKIEVRKSSDGWRVLDVDGERERVIETLSAIDDGRAQADAIARDYLTTISYHDAEASTAAGGRR